MVAHDDRWVDNGFYDGQCYLYFMFLINDNSVYQYAKYHPALLNYSSDIFYYKSSYFRENGDEHGYLNCYRICAHMYILILSLSTY